VGNLVGLSVGFLVVAIGLSVGRLVGKGVAGGKGEELGFGVTLIDGDGVES
jgi:hypothetical protein